MDELPGYCGAVPAMRIPLKDPEKNMAQARRVHSRPEIEIQDLKCNEMAKPGIIVPSAASRYALNVTMPGKKDAEGNWTDRRFCVDARPLNENTETDPYVSPLPEAMFQKIGSCSWLTKLDLRSAFLQIPIAPEDQDLTCFWWGGREVEIHAHVLRYAQCHRAFSENS